MLFSQDTRREYLQRQALVKVVGVGANGETLFPRVIKEANVLIGGKRLLERFQHLNCRKITLGKNLKETFSSLYDKSSGNIVVLASGDPLFFGIGKTLLNLIPVENIEFYPYINSVQHLCSKIGLSYEDIVNISFHGRNMDKIKLLNTINKNSKISILTDRDNNINKIARYLDKGNFSDNLDIFVGQMLGTKEENIIKTDVMGLVKIHPSELDTLIILNKNPAKGIETGIEDNKFLHEKSLITKKEIRIISVSYLSLKKDSVLWDIGAGSGSISIEASFFAPEGKIFAIEKNEERVKDIYKNIKKFNCYNIDVITGDANKVIKNLPEPSRVFIGGNSGGVVSVLSYLKKILKKNSIVVINLVSVDKIFEIISFCKENSLQMESTCVQVNNLSPLAHSFYYKGSNPVYIFKITF